MKRLLASLIALFLFSPVLAQEEELLEPDRAFDLVSVRAVDGERIEAHWRIADGYYLYRDRISFTTETPGVELGTPELPKGKVKNDEFFGKVETYRGDLKAVLPVKRTGAGNAALELQLTAKSQGCADQGVCYPPHRQTRTVKLPALAASAALPAGDFGFGGGEEEFLEPEQAFQLSSEVVDGNTVRLHWAIAPKHYLYRDKFAFEVTDPEGVSIAGAQIPAGEEKNDEFFGRIQVFHDEVTVTLPLNRAVTDATRATVKATYQGCAEAGICYPPLNESVALDLPAGSAEPSAGSETIAPPAEPLSQQDSLAASLASGNTTLTILTFFGLGLLLAFTPCVFPMIPILSSIIVGQGENITTRRAFTMSLVYVLAMAVTYSLAGVVAGLFGANLQAAFQNPWILGTFSAVFVALAFSMFGFYDLQLPSSWQSKLSEVSNRQQGGSLIGVGIMGLLSALIVGPCVAPPLMGALIYIGQTGDPWLGFLALFALSMGMGLPLLAIGTAGGKYLPRAGGWMDAVKAVFGVLLLAVAVWMLERILPASVTMLLWAVLLIIPAIYMGALDRIGDGSGWRKLWKGLGVMLLIWGGLLLVGVATGGKDPLSPLSHLRVAGGGSAAVGQPAHLEFRTIKSVADLERELQQSAEVGQPVMLDFYADWCVSCKEFEKYTFSDPAVMQALSGAKLLQADVTANDEHDKGLLKPFRLIGPPAILFWDAEGNEKRNSRVVGFMGAEEFAQHVRRAIP